MGQEHVDRIREGIHKMSFDLVDLFGDGRRGDPSSAFDVGGLAPDVEIVFVGPAPGVSDFNYTGPAGLAEGWRDWLEPWKTYIVEIEGFVDGGCDVVTLVTLRGETRHGGVTVEQPAAAVLDARRRSGGARRRPTSTAAPRSRASGEADALS